MLDETFKAEWIAALESEEYAKGKGKLWNKGSIPPKRMCCLGVAGDLLVKKGLARWYNHTLCDPGEGFYALDPDGVIHDASSSGYLPGGLRCLIGLTDGDQLKLASTNDKSETFAPVIEIIKGL